MQATSNFCFHWYSDFDQSAGESSVTTFTSTKHYARIPKKGNIPFIYITIYMQPCILQLKTFSERWMANIVQEVAWCKMCVTMQSPSVLSNGCCVAVTWWWCSEDKLATLKEKLLVTGVSLQGKVLDVEPSESLAVSPVCPVTLDAAHD